MLDLTGYTVAELERNLAALSNPDNALLATARAGLSIQIAKELYRRANAAAGLAPDGVTPLD